MDDFREVDFGSFMSYLNSYTRRGMRVRIESWSVCDPPVTLHKAKGEIIGKWYHPYMNSPDRYFING